MADGVAGGVAFVPVVPGLAPRGFYGSGRPVLFELAFARATLAAPRDLGKTPDEPEIAWPDKECRLGMTRWIWRYSRLPPILLTLSSHPHD